MKRLARVFFFIIVHIINMNMLQDIEKFMQSVGSSNNYRIINLGGTSLYIEGVKSVVSFGESEMQFQLKKQLLVVAGRELKVKYLDKSTCVIIGNIISVVVK